MSASKKILFSLTGSIACFKACELLSQLKKQGFDIQVVATSSALKFVGEMTLEGITGKKILRDLFEPGSAMDHIHLIKWADLHITCPVSANKINEFASGMGSDLLSCLFLAYDFKKPWYLVPAMNPTMYAHPVTQKSIISLKELGMKFIGPSAGDVACGDYGLGRMVEVTDIIKTIQEDL